MCVSGEYLGKKINSILTLFSIPQYCIAHVQYVPFRVWQSSVIQGWF